MNRDKRMEHLRFYGKLALTLFAITAAAALLLSVVNGITAEPIAGQNARRRQAAMEAVVPGADRFSQAELVPEGTDDLHVAYKGEVLLGYCVELSADGFGGPMNLMVGVSEATGSVTGVSVVSHNETAGLGANAANADFLRQFWGRSGTIILGPGKVEAVSGATITSRAVTQGVNDALRAVIDYKAGGGGAGEEGKV